MSSAALHIAVLGAESTGKTWLAQALGEHLRARGLRVQVVGEYLREWCDRHQRTPQAHEQAGIAAEQSRRIRAAQSHSDVVIADTTALMTAVYSELLFGDTSLYAHALAEASGFSHTLVTGLDLPWVADGLQRDGPQVREPVDQLLRTALQRGGIRWRVVYGQGPMRLTQALTGLLPDGEGGLKLPRNPQRWVCDKCSDPDCERHLFTRLV